jgi:hypothetical protein
VLAAGDLEHPESAHDQADDQDRAPVLDEHADRGPDPADEDQQLGHRHIPERPGGPLALGPQLPRRPLVGPPRLGLVLGRALGAELASRRDDCAGRPVRRAALA